MNNLEHFADNLKRNRKMKGFSQERLALDAGIDRTYIQILESKKANPSLKVIDKLADTLKISINDFFV